MRFLQLCLWPTLHATTESQSHQQHWPSEISVLHYLAKQDVLPMWVSKPRRMPCLCTTRITAHNGRDGARKRMMPCDCVNGTCSNLRPRLQKRRALIGGV